MDWPTIARSKASLLTFCLSAAVALAVSAFGEDNWITYTSANLARRMLIANDTLFMATSGGLLVTNPNDLAPGRILTNLDGLGTTDLTDIILDSQGQKWVAGNGRLLKFDISASEQFLFQDNENNLIRLQCLADDGNFIWVGYPAGVVLFDKTKDGGLIQDSYQMFGSLPASPSVTDVLIIGDSIWLATSAGIAVADKSDPRLLKLSSAWISFSSSSNPELGGTTVRRLSWFRNQLIVATSSGLFRLDRSLSDTVFTKLGFGPTSDFTDLRIERDTLFVYCDNGLGAMVDSTVATLSISGLPSRPFTGAGSGANRWAGLASGGIYRTDNTGEFVRYAYTGMPDNDVVDIAISDRDHVNVAYARKPMAELVDNQWVSKSYTVDAFATKLFSDPSGTRWAGMFGGGLWQIGQGAPKRFDTTGTTLRGNNDQNGKNYIVITGIATDGPHLYAACFRAYDGDPIAFANLDQLDSRSGWGSLGISNGITDTFIVGLDYAGGYFAAATDANGLYLYYVGPDPFNTGDDTCHYLNKANSGLRSDIVRVVKFAPDSSLWVGTNFGLSHYDRGIDRFVDVNLPAGVGPDVTDLDFDSRGVLWVSARNGIARFDPSGGFRTYHAISSGLVSDDIRSLTLNRRTGDLWVGTSAGVSELKSPVTALTEAIDSVWAFPNPFVIDSPDDSLSVNYAFPGTVSIFDVSGALVDEFPVREGWRGTNRAGKPVASGVYIFVIQNATGQIGRGKFLLVRQ